MKKNKANILDSLIGIMTRLASLVYVCNSNLNTPDLQIRNKFPGDFLRSLKKLVHLILKNIHFNPKARQNVKIMII